MEEFNFNLFQRNVIAELESYGFVCDEHTYTHLFMSKKKSNNLHMNLMLHPTTGNNYAMRVIYGGKDIGLSFARTSEASKEALKVIPFIFDNFNEIRETINIREYITFFNSLKDNKIVFETMHTYVANYRIDNNSIYKIE